MQHLMHMRDFDNARRSGKMGPQDFEQYAMRVQRVIELALDQYRLLANDMRIGRMCGLARSLREKPPTC